MRPPDLELLAPTLESLATYGGARVEHAHISWLHRIGVSVRSHSGWAVPCDTWLQVAAPAHDRLDLLRRTAVRDSGYRAHLDLSIASVLSTIGAAGRWKRFDELLQGALLPFAPRYVQLIEWLESRYRRRCLSFVATAWAEAEALVAGNDAETFTHWDQKLWGAGGNVAALFALLQDQYVPMVALPIHFDVTSLHFGGEAELLLHSLVEAARRGEGVGTSPAQRDAVDSLLAAGVPVRLLVSGPHTVAALVNAVSVSASVESREELYTSRTFTVAIPEHAAQSCFRDLHLDGNVAATFWDCAEAGECAPGFLSLPDDAGAWPETRPETPPWAQLPVAEMLRGMDRARRESPEVDQGLQELANHRLFGFILQVLLVEALDRELGEETLVLAPPTERRVDDIEGATRIFYRPRRQVIDGATGPRQESYDLGTIDSVFGELAKGVGIRNVNYLYSGPDLGPWSRAIRIMRSAELVIGLFDRWTIAPHVLDRLHGGGMMTTVIRRGRQLRERLHSALLVMWTARRNAAASLEVQHG